MILQDDANPCSGKGPGRSPQTPAEGRVSDQAPSDQMHPPRLSEANTVVSTRLIFVIALIDSVSVPVPASVTGRESACAWLERNFRDAGTAAFYRAERIADHPHLISGGVYAPTTELAFLTRRPEA
ncbi:MAG: hypothetical protein AB8B85_23120 [Paracoccaceae bacterium]